LFPKGLLVGHVRNVELDEAGLYQTAWLNSAADLGRLEYAFVVATEQDLEQAVMEDSSVDMGLVDGRAAEGETP
jgi:cell shape-determining protein MreC